MVQLIPLSKENKERKNGIYSTLFVVITSFCIINTYEPTFIILNRTLNKNIKKFIEIEKGDIP